MKNYELISKLSELPAGSEVVFDSILESRFIEEDEDGNFHVNSKINDIDTNGNEIFLF